MVLFYPLKQNFRHNRVVGYLKNFLTDRVDGAPELETLVKDAASGNTDPLELAVEKFFASLRVKDKSTGESLLPKKGTMDVYKSHIKVMCLTRSKKSYIQYISVLRP